MGTDINSNIGTLDNLHSTKFCAALGPYGLLKRNKKGENLLVIYLAHRLRVMNTFLKRDQRVRGTALGPAINPPTQKLRIPTCLT